MIPTTVEIDFNELDLSSNPADDEIGEAAGDYITDKYGFCHFGFNWETKNGFVVVTNILWDFSD